MEITFLYYVLIWEILVWERLLYVMEAEREDSIQVLPKIFSLKMEAVH